MLRRSRCVLIFFKQEESRITNQDNKIARFYPCTPNRPGCIHRRVCTGQTIPYTYLQMCGGLKITKVLFGRTSSAGLLFFLVPGGHELFRSLQHLLVPRRPIVHLRRKGPYVSVNSECEPVVHRRAICDSERLEVVLETIHPILLRAPLAWIFPPNCCKM